MARFIDNVRVLNSVVRTGLVVVVLAGAAYGTYLGYSNYVRPGLRADQVKQELAEATAQLTDVRRSLAELTRRGQEQQTIIDEQTAQLSELTRTNEQLAMANKLLKVDQRVARIKVLEKGPAPGSNEEYVLVEFQEVDGQGAPLGQAARYRLKGNRLYVDAFIVKFDDQFIESGDALRATSMFMFRRIFGEGDGLDGGFPLDMDEGGTVRAAAYVHGQRVSSLEQKIWRDFWAISNDPRRQRELGVRNNHGQINYIDPQPGQTYELTLRSSDGLSFNIVQE